MLMTNAKEKSKAGTGTRKCWGRGVAISDKGLRKTHKEIDIKDQKEVRRWTHLGKEHFRQKEQCKGHHRGLNYVSQMIY